VSDYRQGACCFSGQDGNYNDSADSPFASLTCQLQQFGRMFGIHASAVGHAHINGDFIRGYKNPDNDGAYHKLSDEMRSSLLTFTLR
jgi:hypothetical protein